MACLQERRAITKPTSTGSIVDGCVEASLCFGTKPICERAKEKYLQDRQSRFQVDGIIYHDAKTCPYNSNNRYGLPQRLESRTGVPSPVLSGDLNDLRCVSDGCAP